RVEEARIEARLGVEYWIGVKADDRDEEIAEALVARAIADPASRAMSILLERRLGRVVGRLELSTTSKQPDDMDAAELTAWIASQMEPAEAAAFVAETQRLEEQFKLQD